MCKEAGDHPYTNYIERDGFILSADPSVREAVDRKIARFKRRHTEIRLETDWDDTIGAGTWPRARTAIPDAEAKIQHLLFTQHQDGLREGSMRISQSRAWQLAALGTLVGKEIRPILNAIAGEDNGGVKPGARELFDICRQNGIPTIIKTASTQQFVRAAARAAGIEPDLIIATDLKVRDGIITGWDDTTLTYTHQKHTPPGTNVMQTHPYGIGLGDGLFDRMMIPPGQDTLWVRANGGTNYGDANYLEQSFQPLRVTDDRGGEDHELTYPPYDLVSVAPNLLATCGLMRILTS